VNTGLTDEEIREDSPIIYNDTDSLVFDTKITTNIGEVTIGDLYETTQTNHDLSYHGHEIKPVNHLHTLTFKNNKASWGKIKNLIRHKVTKGKYKIKVAGHEVIMTEDHGCLVYRDGHLQRLSPKEIKKGDKMVIYNDTQKNLSL
jgi:hypothetical protein